MKHVVSFSGGRTSAYLVHLMEQKRKKEGLDVEYVFMDTGAEHPKTYEFIKNLVRHWGVNLRCIRAVIHQEVGVGVTYEEISVDDIGWDLSIWKDMLKKYGVPSAEGAPFCTDRLKTTAHDKFCNDVFGRGAYTTWLGIRVDEKRRLKQRKGIRYLAEISQADKNQILGWWREQDFDLNLDEWLGNCVFCIKKGINKLALAAIQEPELAADWISVTSSNEVRIKHEKDGTEVSAGRMYRGKLTLDGIAELYADKDADEIVQTMRLRRGCAVEQGESCEVFGCQGDLFEGAA